MGDIGGGEHSADDGKQAGPGGNQRRAILGSNAANRNRRKVELRPRAAQQIG
jgi:hypothetical protein